MKQKKNETRHWGARGGGVRFCFKLLNDLIFFHGSFSFCFSELEVIEGREGGLIWSSHGSIKDRAFSSCSICQSISTANYYASGLVEHTSKEARSRSHDCSSGTTIETERLIRAYTQTWPKRKIIRLVNADGILRPISILFATAANDHTGSACSKRRTPETTGH